MPRDDAAARPLLIVGWGNVAERFYGSAVRYVDSLEIHHVAEADAEGRKRAELAFPTAKVASSIAEIGAAPSGGAALNLTPIQRHSEVTEELLELGWHVYSEKPAAPTPEEWQRLAGLANEAGRILVSAPASPYGSAARGLAEIVSSGALGIPQMVNVEIALAGPGAKSPLERARSWFLACGSGVVSDIGIYGTAHVVKLFGKPERVHWHASTARRDVLVGLDGGQVANVRAQSPDAWVAVLSWPNGVTGSMSISYRPGRPPKSTIEVHGTRRSALCQLEDVASEPIVVPALDEAPTGHTEYGACDPADVALAKYVQSLSFFADCIEGLVNMEEHHSFVRETLALSGPPMAVEQGDPLQPAHEGGRGW